MARKTKQAQINELREERRVLRAQLDGAREANASLRAEVSILADEKSVFRDELGRVTEAREAAERAIVDLRKERDARPTLDEVRAVVGLGFLKVTRPALAVAKTFRELCVIVEAFLMVSGDNEDPSAAPTCKPERHFRLFLTHVGENMIGVIKAVRTVSTLGLKEAKDICDIVRATDGAGQAEISFGYPGGRLRTESEIIRAKSTIEAAGGSVRVEEVV